jgi:hypothetical protein
MGRASAMASNNTSGTCPRVARVSLGDGHHVRGLGEPGTSLAHGRHPHRDRGLRASGAGRVGSSTHDGSTMSRRQTCCLRQILHARIPAACGEDHRSGAQPLTPGRVTPGPGRQASSVTRGARACRRSGGSGRTRRSRPPAR